jgi:hypothetical protein
VGVAPGAPDLLALRALALGPVRERRVVAERGDESGDPLAERLAQLVGRGVGGLDRVVEQPRGDDLVVEPAVAEQARHLERVQDERGEVRVAALAGVVRGGVGEGGSRDRERLDERGRSERAQSR